ncbi:NADH-quinone oxidoreductase subunit NuoE family protein [Photobacterium angustum]|uniref:NADH-quinone oxidoreductase subunit NuoE family protein n=1 Tax=Photobacterium angustum TaxID=661 RepID=UPI002091F7A2|nr:NAD(P)H-dependent oxidoreductase subunit E [Photobacterium angustum]
MQDKYGYITKPSLNLVSELTDLSTTQLDELITFYTLLRRRPVGRNVMRVCDSISCHTRGAKKSARSGRKCNR